MPHVQVNGLINTNLDNESIIEELQELAFTEDDGLRSKLLAQKTSREAILWRFQEVSAAVEHRAWYCALQPHLVLLQSIFQKLYSPSGP
jgi:hypothetical protein